MKDLPAELVRFREIRKRHAQLDIDIDIDIATRHSPSDEPSALKHLLEAQVALLSVSRAVPAASPAC